MEKKTVFTSPGISTREGGEFYYPNLSKEFYDIKSLVSKFSNDQELGRELRRYFNTPNIAAKP
ncbi:MAG: hypothetical protein KA007_00060 [Candidatus Pacebacteria bacterium]|nr:hypothetical protein [Candidatus Paceibacterota bacterium]